MLELLGAQDQPSIELVSAWLRELHSRHNDSELSDDDLGLALRLLTLLCSIASESTSTVDLTSLELFAPDTAGKMRPTGALCLNDAPWVASRVDLEALPILHPRVSLKVLVKLS